jgi:L-alanine-DL-glutamate epimerase-like enolase superfamily enzyme
MLIERSTSRIRAVDVFAARVPRIEESRITTSYATLDDAHHAVVRVTVDDVEGYGEAPTERWWTGEDLTSVHNAITRYLAPALVDGPAGPRDAIVAMERALAGNSYAKAAVEMALWDALGKMLGAPLFQLLGRSVARPLRVKYVIGMVDAAAARAEAAAAVERGFTHLKIKVGGSLDSDLERVHAAIEGAGPGVRVGVDANGGWSLQTAVAALKPLEEANVSFLEQPVSPRFPRQLAEVRRRASVPLVAHESLFTVTDALRCRDEGAADIWSVTPSTHGGLVPTARIIGIAEAAGIPCLIGSTVELGIATAFLAHVGSAFDAIADCPIPSDVIGPFYHAHDIVLERFETENGCIRAPGGPGLGIEPDWNRLEPLVGVSRDGSPVGA